MQILSYFLGFMLSVLSTFSFYVILINPSVFQNDFSKIAQYWPALLIYSLTIVEFVLNFTTKKNIIVIKSVIISSFVSAFSFYAYRYFANNKINSFDFKTFDYILILITTTVIFLILYYFLSIAERKTMGKIISIEYVIFPFLFFIFAFNPFFYLFNNSRLINVVELLPLGILVITAVAAFFLIIKAGMAAIAVPLGFLLSFIVTGVLLVLAYFSQNLAGNPGLSLFICIFLIFLYCLIPNIIIEEKIRK